MAWYGLLGECVGGVGVSVSIKYMSKGEYMHIYGAQMGSAGVMKLYIVILRWG
jgi:hypothetical protein